MGDLSKTLRICLTYIAVPAMLLMLVVFERQLAPLHSTRPEPPQLLHGAIDVSQWHFAEDGNVSLNGLWRYYSQRWSSEIAAGDDGRVGAPVPGAWPAEPGADSTRQSGHATYVLRLKLPDTPEHDRLALSTGYWHSAYRVYANGELIATSGRPAADGDQEVGRAYSLIAVLPPVKEIELRFEISNHIDRHGGAFAPPIIGLESTLRSQSDIVRTVSACLVGSMLFAALYHMVLFWLDPVGRSNMWFAFFATALGVRTLLIDPLASYSVEVIGQDWVWRVDYASSMILLPLCYQFFMLSFPRQVSARYAPWIWGFGAGAACLTLVGGPVPGEWGMKVTEFVCVPFIAYITFSLSKAVFQKENGATLSLAGWALCATASVHDIILENGLIDSINLIPFGFLAFFLCLSGMLASQFRTAYRQAQTVSNTLRNVNHVLEEAVQKRTAELEEKVVELERHQQALEKAREDAVSANTAKSRFLATMSHELRTPLNSILGFSEIIRDEKLGPISDSKYAEYAGHINESGAHLLSLIGDILDMSRIEAGKLQLEFEELVVEDVVKAALNRAATRERRAADTVEVNLGPDLPMLMADRRTLLQMLINLISNALKFTPAGGKITLSAFLRPDGGVTVQVADTGIGMEPEDIPKALQPFSQVDDNLWRRHEGSGLGLAIVKSLMEQHQGTLTLQSAKGTGTTAQLEFPAARTVHARLSATQFVRAN